MGIMLFTSNYVELEHEINSKTVDFLLQNVHFEKS